MDLPIGYDNFGKVIANHLDFVDKSLFIKEIIDDKSTEAVVITRPRRFGKTLNLSMLHHYLAAEVNGRPTRGLFDHLKIANTDERYKQYQGKYPVIFVTFKDIKNAHYKGAYSKLCNLMSDVYSEHQLLLSSPHLSRQQKQLFELMLNRQGSEADLTSSLKNLTKYLALHYGVNPWLLIDEYDSPIQASYMHGYYEEMIDFMRNLLGEALKTNPYLERAVITGILRIAKESLFSGVNNLRVYSLLHPSYSEHFGFTEEEVQLLIRKANLESIGESIKEWYNGYQFGNTILYNPWSIANCIQEKGKLEPYWINTSDNQLIKDMLINSNDDFKAQFELLLQNNTVEHIINDNTVFGDLKISSSAPWSLLLMAGYLKVISQRRTDQGLWCTLTIPNREVRNLYREIIEQWLSNEHGIEWYNHFLDHLLTGNIAAFEQEMEKLMEHTISVHDMSRDPESFYHGLMLGLTASLSTSKNYEIKSNRESGYGQYDYLIFSHDKAKPTLLLEFKKVDAVKDKTLLTDKLEQAALEALKQIDEQKYLAEAQNRGRTHILKIGLAFCGKRFKILSTSLTLPV